MKSERLAGHLLLVLLVIGMGIGGTVLYHYRARAEITPTLAAMPKDRTETVDSYRLAAAARQQLPIAPDLALLLAAEAATRERTPTSEQVLRDAIWQRPFTARVLVRQSIRNPSISPDGQYLLSWDGADGSSLWDLSGQRRARFGGVAVFAGDGRHVLSATVDRTMLWDLSGQQLQTIDEIFVDGCSPNGERFLTRAREGDTISLWDMKGQRRGTFHGYNIGCSNDGQRIFTFLAGRAWLWDRRGGRVSLGQDTAARFSPDSQHVLTWSSETPEGVHLWDLQGQLLHTFRGEEGAVSPDGQQVLTLDRAGSAYLWSMDGTQLTTFAAMPGSISFTPDGAYIVIESPGTPGSLGIWDLSGTPVLSLPGYTHQLSPDGHYLIAQDRLGGASLWDLAGRELATFPDAFASWWPTGHRILTWSERDSDVLLWDLDSAPLTFFGHGRDAVLDAVYSPDAQYVLTTVATAPRWSNGRLLDYKGSRLQLWTVQGQQVSTFEGASAGFFSPDSRALLTTTGYTSTLRNLSGQQLLVLSGHARGFSPDGRLIMTEIADSATVQLWDNTGKRVAVFRGREPQFSPDGQLILALDERREESTLWDLSGQQRASVAGFPLRFSPDSQQFLSRTTGTGLQLWDSTGKLLITIEGKDAAFSPDSQSLLVSQEHTAQLWSRDGQPGAIFSLDHERTISRVSFSPDGQHIVIEGADDTPAGQRWPVVTIWERSGQRNAVIEDVGPVQWSPDPHRLITGNAIWDVQGRQQASLHGPSTLSADGRRLLVTSNYQARQELLDTDALLALASCRLSRELTVAERERFGVGKPRFQINPKMCV